MNHESINSLKPTNVVDLSRIVKAKSRFSHCGGTQAYGIYSIKWPYDAAIIATVRKLNDLKFYL